MLSVNNTKTCFKCGSTITTGFNYRDILGWLCQICAPAKVPCKYAHLGCTYIDFPSKQLKHEFYYCSHSPYCGVCTKKISTSLLEHFGNVHDNSTHRAGERFLVYHNTSNDNTDHLVLTDCGPVIVGYLLNKDLLTVDVMAPIPSDFLQKFTCTLQLVDPLTGTEFINIVRDNYTDIRDWYFSICPKAFPDWSGNLEIGVFVSANCS